MSEGSQAHGDRMTVRGWRLWAAAIAIVAWIGLILQAALLFHALQSWTATLWRLASFFTVLSNLVVAVLFSGIALGIARMRHPQLVAAAALTMALVGTTFELMLRRQLNHSGWQLVAEGLLHDAVPLLTAGAWLFLAEKGRLRRRDPWLIALFPIGYLAYALVRGAYSGRYPYPFIDPTRIGWPGVAAYVVGISAVFLGVGHLMVVLDGWLARRR